MVCSSKQRKMGTQNGNPTSFLVSQVTYRVEEQNKTKQQKKKTKKINKQTKNQNKEKYLKARFPGTFSKSKGKKRPNKG